MNGFAGLRVRWCLQHLCHNVECVSNMSVGTAVTPGGQVDSEMLRGQMSKSLLLPQLALRGVIIGDTDMQATLSSHYLKLDSLTVLIWTRDS